MSDEIDSRTACQWVRCSRVTLLRWAKRLGLGRDLAGGKVFSPAEIERLRAAFHGAAGNPHWTKKTEE